MRLLITASREWTDVERIHRTLNTIRNRPLTVVHGGARGGDRIAAQWARDTEGVFEEAHPVSREAWRFSRQAGLERNSFMVNMGADLCIAFWLNHSSGTRDCMSKAIDAGIPTLVVEVNTALPASHKQRPIGIPVPRAVTR